MKNVRAVAFVVCLCSSVVIGQIPAPPAPSPNTLLRLKSGDEVKGRLVEVKDGTYVLTLPDGRTVLYPTTDVASAERIKSEGTPGRTGPALLAPNLKVWVRPTQNDTSQIFENSLREWGRWRVVDKEEEADLAVRLMADGSSAWGLASVVAIIEEPTTGAEIWKSKKSKGTRNIFHGYDSPFHRAAKGIVEQMKKASESWSKS